MSWKWKEYFIELLNPEISGKFSDKCKISTCRTNVETICWILKRRIIAYMYNAIRNPRDICDAAKNMHERYPVSNKGWTHKVLNVWGKNKLETGR